MWRTCARTTRATFLCAVLALVVSGMVASTSIIGAARATKPLPDAKAAVIATERATMAAAAIEARLDAVGDVLGALVEKGAARAGGGRAMKLAAKAFEKLDGLEQLAAYGPDGRVRWVMRPANLGRMRFPDSVAFVEAHLARPDLPLKLAAPVKPSARSGWWMPVSLVVRNKAGASAAVIVAFLKADSLLQELALAGDVVALFTDDGTLASALPAADAPVGVSFRHSPGMQLIEGMEHAGGAYASEATSGPNTPSIVGFRRLACCGAVVTAVRRYDPAPPPLPMDVEPIGRWLALAAACLLAMMAGAAILRRSLHAASPDPWRDFGRDRVQPSA